MKTIVMALALIASGSAFAATDSKIVCATTGSIDNINYLEISSDGKGALAVTLSDQKSDRPNVKFFNTIGSLTDAKIQLSVLERGPFGTDRVYLEKTATGYAVVKSNQCSFSYQEETCSSQEDEQFSELSRETVVACTIVQ